MNILYKSINYTKYTLFLLFMLLLVFAFPAANPKNFVNSQSQGQTVIEVTKRVRVAIDTTTGKIKLDASNNPIPVKLDNAGNQVTLAAGQTPEIIYTIPNYSTHSLTQFPYIALPSSQVDYDLFFGGLTPTVTQSYTLKLPAALVGVKYVNGTTQVLDGYNPDHLYIYSYTNNQADYVTKNPGTVLKSCNTQSPPPNQTPECSVAFNIPLNVISSINSSSNPSDPSSKSVVDSSGKFISKSTYSKTSSDSLSNLASTDYSKNNILIEYCYSNAVSYNNNNNYGGRDIIGSSLLSNYNVYPNFLEQSGRYRCNTPLSGSLASANFTSNTNNQYGEYNKTDQYGALVCDLNSNPLIATDIFGNKTVGVQTALGCLPGNLNGVFAVILRIAIGISSAILFILILINGIIIITGNPEPAKIKAAIGNITKGITAIVIIIFSVFILNIIGVKIIPLGTLGGASIEQVVGK